MFYRHPHAGFRPQIVGAAGYIGPADAVGVTPFVFYGLRAMSAAVIGINVIQIQWLDTTTINYPTIAGGGLNLTTITTDQSTHGGPGQLIRIYDQTGGGNHFLPGGGAPTLNLSGFGSLPSIDAVAAGTQWMGTASLTQPNLPMTFAFVAKHTTSAGQQLLSGTGASPGGAILYRNSANDQVALFNGTGVTPATALDNQFNSIIGNFTSPSSGSFVTVNGVNGSTADPGTGGGASGVLTLFADGGGGQNFDGGFEEWGIWGGFSGAQRTALYGNHHGYYGV